MRTIGIIGGIGPESTIDYYRLLIDAYRSRVRDGSYPSIVINSIDVGKVLGFAMAGAFYPAVFGAGGIALVTPRAEEQGYIHDRYLGELLKGHFADETRGQFERIIARLRDEESIDGVILAGTELPLLLRGSAIEGVAMLDTTRLHVDAIIETLLA